MIMTSLREEKTLFQQIADIIDYRYYGVEYDQLDRDIEKILKLFEQYIDEKILKHSKELEKQVAKMPVSPTKKLLTVEEVDTMQLISMIRWKLNAFNELKQGLKEGDSKEK